MVTLEVLDGDLRGKVFRLDREESVIGRLPYCEVPLPERSISRQHARVLRVSGEFFLEDMNSTNGTFLNGRRLQTRSRLQDNDVVRVYNTPLLFRQHLPADAGAPAAPAASPTAAAAHTAPPAPARITLTGLEEETRGVGLNVYEKLRVVLEMHRRLGRTLNASQVLPKILEGLFSVFPQSDRGYILLPQGDSDQLVVSAHRQKEEGTFVGTGLGPISTTIARRVMSKGEAVLFADGLDGSDLDISDSVLDFPIRSMMCAPLLGPMEKPLGIIYLDTSDPRERFHEDDLEVLVSVAATAGQALEYAAAHEARMRLVEREREMALAKEVQLRFLSGDLPAVPGYRLYKHYSAAEEVGGDYYGFVPMESGRIAVAVGDVSGKGMWAALIMAHLCSEVRFRLATTASPVEAFHQLNQEFCKPENEAWFVTLLLCILDPQNHELTLLNAGHMPPFCRRAATGELEELSVAEAGPPLGCDPAIQYQPWTIRLHPGDALLMYTDGINEAMNAQLEPYGRQRLRQALSVAPAPLVPLCRWLLDDVERFAGQHPQSDDICLLGLQRE